jgi:Arc/MetJ-type ribon-helix-helix transcriptional regulator
MLIRLDGAIQLTLDELVTLGYFKTKNEAIRAGILELGKEYKIEMGAQKVEDALALAKMQEIDKDVQKGKRKLNSLEHVIKKYKIKKEALK